MKLAIEKAELERALYRVQGIVDKRASGGVLSHTVLWAREDGTLQIAAADRELYLTGRYPAQITQPGQLMLAARHLYDVVRSLGDEMLHLSLADGQRLEIRASSSLFHIPASSPEDFPAQPEESHADKLLIASAALQTLVDRTAFCASTDENRPNICGVYWHTPQAGLLRSVSTDGHRLARAQWELSGASRLQKGVILPRKGCQELRRLLSDFPRDAAVTMQVGAAHAMFAVEGVSLAIRLIDDVFPAYEQVIPQEACNRAKISRTSFVEALKRVGLVAQDRASGVRFEFTKHTLVLAAENANLGDAREEIPIQYTGQEPLVVGFNARYVLDVLALIPEQSVCFELTDDLSPGILRPLEDTSFLAVVMPMRI